jgi:glycosyltransferase involved in cell wall biosynthesis
VTTGAGVGGGSGPEALPGRVCVVLPALNEADALPAALAGFPPAGRDRPRLIVVDNGSTDGTAAVARRLGAEVVHEPRRGFGAACWAGVLAAGEAEVVAFMDADGSLDWADLDTVSGPVLAGAADLVLGRRRRDLREPGAMTWHVAAANRSLAWLTGRLVGVELHDLGPFRAVRRDVLVGLGMRDRGYGWPLEMVLRAARAGLRVVEVPVRYRRRAGTSKVTGRPWPTVKATLRMTWMLARHAVTPGSRD